MNRSRLERWKARVGELKFDTYALYLAARDPRVPWYAKAVVGLVVAYALSPIDLIPDFIPVIGYLDDLLLVPLGIALAVRLIPDAILAEHRAAARELLSHGRPRSWVGAGIVCAIWLAAIVWTVSVLRRALEP